MHYYAKKEPPPVNALRQVTFYDKHGFQVVNPLNQLATGDCGELK